MYHSSIPKLFASAQTALYNANEQPEIQKKMGQYGFPPKRLQAGKALLEHALLLHSDKDDKYGEKQELSSLLEKEEQMAKEKFKDHVATVKLAFRKEPRTLAKFKINRISRKVEDWILQANYFYHKAAMYSDILEGYQLPREELSQNQASVEAIIAIRNRRMQKKGEAEEATRARNMAIKALSTWMKEFRGIARIALKDNPQLLEALNIKVPSKV